MIYNNINIRENLKEAYSDVYTSEVLSALSSMAHFSYKKKGSASATESFLFAIALRYYYLEIVFHGTTNMINSFSCKETEKIWNGKISRKFPSTIQQTARRKLVHINSAISVNDLRVPPGNRLEKLEGGLKGYHSIRINDQWRIIFKWLQGNAFDVAIVDYH
jgi:proteic killer suppression protein